MIPSLVVFVDHLRPENTFWGSSFCRGFVGFLCRVRGGVCGGSGTSLKVLCLGGCTAECFWHESLDIFWLAKAQKLHEQVENEGTCGGEVLLMSGTGCTIDAWTVLHAGSRALRRCANFEAAKNKARAERPCANLHPVHMGLNSLPPPFHGLSCPALGAAQRRSLAAKADLLRSARVVGMTTTGAAMSMALLERVRPRVVLARRRRPSGAPHTRSRCTAEGQNRAGDRGVAGRHGANGLLPPEAEHKSSTGPLGCTPPPTGCNFEDGQG